ncbi:MAG TPA: TadE/TadG family type IV pilus assembly protein [Gemmataceae bacterium]|nr:TadE/TadG family type IV pilus assembly protein [Gemmataceae bacterium]
MRAQNILSRSRYSAAKRCRRWGTAAVEMAFIVPILGLIVMGMFELSRGVMVKQILTGAARKGCRTGIIHQYGNSDIINDATNVMRDNSFDSTLFNPPTVGSITITVTDPNGNTLSDALDAAPGSKVTVQVAIPVTSFKWVSMYFLTGTMFESDSVVMMKQ